MIESFADHVVIPSDTQTASHVQMRIVGLLERLEYPVADVMGVRLALEEILMNAIKHGNERDPGKVVKIDFDVSPERVRVTVEDEGEGFRPDAVPDPTLPENLERPGGRGVFLIRQFMTSVEYNARGNRVKIVKDRSETDPLAVQSESELSAD